MRIPFAVVLALAGAPISAAFSQEAPSRMTLAEVLEHAEAHAPQIEVADARVAEAETARLAPRALWRPNVDLTGVYTLNDEETTVSFPNPLAALAPYLAAAAAADPRLPDPTLLVTAPGTELTTQLRHDVRGIATVTQPLWQPFAAPARRRAQAAIETALAGQSLASWQIREAAQTLYFDALRYDALSRAAERNVELARLAEERAISALALGTGSELERDRASLARIEAEQQVRSAQAGRTAVLDALATLAGIEGAIEPVMPEPIVETDLRREVSDALPEIALAESRAELVRSESDTVRAGAIPIVMATGNVMAHRESTFAPDPVDWSVQVAAQWSLYDGGTRRAERTRIEAGELAALSEADALREEAESELRRAWIAHDDAVARLALATEQVALAERAWESSERAWQAGAVSRIEVDTALERANAARLQLAVAEVDLIALRYEIVRLSGR